MVERRHNFREEPTHTAHSRPGILFWLHVALAVGLVVMIWVPIMRSQIGDGARAARHNMQMAEEELGRQSFGARQYIKQGSGAATGSLTETIEQISQAAKQREEALEVVTTIVKEEIQ